MNTETCERPAPAHDPDPRPAPPPRPWRETAVPQAVSAATAVSAAMLAACGGGGGGDGATASDGTAAALSAPPFRRPSRVQASRFLSQAGFGGTRADLDQVMVLGFDGWMTAQFAAPRSSRYVDLISPGGPDADAGDGRVGVERALWRKMISSPDVLRQRVTLALSEIFVVSIANVTVNLRGYACAAFMDVLEAGAFGNYRDLLMQVSTTAAMGAYLTFLNSVKANPVTGSQPDENYARELMQLFTIGLLQLNVDGTPVLVNGVPQETYTQADVQGLARVFTGWALSSDRSTPYSIVTQPMRQVPARHESGTKTFLGTTIPAGTSGEESLRIAIDRLMAHPNMGPFVGRQLIQRLVRSHPSPAYVARVAAAFDGDGTRPKGDLQATLRAVLIDEEAWSDASLTDPQQGKLREPMVRFMQWARLFRLAPPAGQPYNIGNLSDPATELGQSPLRSPSVFNFFRPGYVQPDSALGRLGLTTPEFQITNESSVAGYLNFMQRVIVNGIAGMRGDYTAMQALAPDAAALLAELNVLLAGGQVSATTLALLKPALETIPTTSSASTLRRVQAAVMLLMAAPEYIVQK